MTRSKKPKPPPLPEYPYSVDLYADPRWILSTACTQPIAINGQVNIRRYRVTVELVDEPVEVMRERLVDLWRTSDRNTHLWEPMRRVAEQLGMSHAYPVDTQRIQG